MPTKRVKRIYAFQELLNEQDQLNERTIPNWKERLTVDDYLFAMMAEFNELIDSGRQWKWWKKGPGVINRPNEKIEVVDMCHFYLAALVLTNKARSDRGEYAVIGAFPQVSYGNKILINKDETFNRSAVMGIIRQMITSVMPGSMYELVYAMGMSEEEFSALYAAKCTLNHIRQDCGYNDGTYIKVKDGVEDNERLYSSVDHFMSDPKVSLDDVKASVTKEFRGEKLNGSIGG